jgi:signal transduction histidine kinase
MKFIKKYFQYFDSLIDIPKKGVVEGQLSYWGDLLFVKLLSILLPLSLIVAIPSAVLSFNHNLYFIGFADLFSFMIVLFISFNKSLKLKIKKMVLLSVILILSIILLLKLGFTGPGLIYLIAVTIAATLIFDSRAGYISVLINFIILVIFNLSLHYVSSLPESEWNITLSARLIICGNFLFLNVFSVYAITLLLNGMNKTLKISEDLKKKAEESNNLKTAFLANISHEIRTPMNGIMGFTSLLNNPNLSSETRDQYVQIIQKSGDRMLNTVNDLINISKIETKQEELHNEKFNPFKLVRELYEFFKPLAENKGLRIILKNDYSNEHFMIFTDLTKFTSIVKNLIGNAIKFTRKGVITINCFIENKNIYISIKDTGIGIAQDRQDAVFDRFVQADISDVQAYQGSGLGLSIVKAYVEMMGGTISLESELGQGTCFLVELPALVSAQQTADQTDEPMNTLDLRLKKILIAEDDFISYQHLEICLKPHFCDILHANDGEEAVKMAKENQDIDVILMDIKMPKMDGYDATKAIRRFDRDVLIISQTAYALEDDKEKSLSAGCNAYISKPIDMDALLSIISQNMK